MTEKIPNLDLIPNSLGHMVLDDEQIVQVKRLNIFMSN
jgi:hypothetical protein